MGAGRRASREAPPLPGGAKDCKRNARLSGYQSDGSQFVSLLVSQAADQPSFSA